MTPECPFRESERLKWHRTPIDRAVLAELNKRSDLFSRQPPQSVLWLARTSVRLAAALRNATRGDRLPSLLPHLHYTWITSLPLLE
jgi:hypothetical protein